MLASFPPGLFLFPFLSILKKFPLLFNRSGLTVPERVDRLVRKFGQHGQAVRPVVARPFKVSGRFVSSHLLRKDQEMKKFLMIVAVATVALLADSQLASARRGGCGGGRRGHHGGCGGGGCGGGYC